MHFIFGNYGNNTIALIQWAWVNRLSSVTVLHVDTNWGAAIWQQRVTDGQALAKKYHFDFITLKPIQDFSSLILDRKAFPTAKFQWCPTFLKALPFLSWLDENDPAALSTILLGSTRQDSATKANLPEFVEEHEHYNDRKVWYPLCHISEEERNQLIIDAGFSVLPHRSLECLPCIHSQLVDLKHLDTEQLARVSQLENTLKDNWFQGRYPKQSITALYQRAQNIEDSSIHQPIEMGCGSFYVCGE